MKKYFCPSAILILFLLAASSVAPAQGGLPEATVSDMAAGKISMDLRGIDVVEALKILSDRGKLNMVIGGNIQARVTLFLKDVDIQDALDIILISSGLAYDKKGDILYVMTQHDYEQIYGESFIDKKDARVIKLKYVKAGNIAKNLDQAKSKFGKIIVDDLSNSLVVMDSPASIAQIEKFVEQLDQPVENRIFDLKYAKVEDMKAKISEMLTKDVGVMEIDTRTNKISVSDIPSHLTQIGRMVEAFDEKPRQVLIEAKIVQVTLSDEYKLGVDWQDIFTKLQKNLNVQSNFSLGPTDFSGTGFANGGQLMVSTLGAHGYSMLVQALKTVGDTNLLSSPRITALNNQEAKILVGESLPYATNTVVTPATGATTTASTLSFIDVGVKLFVTPSISSDGFITMKIKPEVSSSSSNYTYGVATGNPGTTVPVVSTTQAETSIRVKDGTTIIIAGLIKDERTRDVSKLPYAGDIPIIGGLFRKTDKSVAKQELVIFIEPHIVSGEYNYTEVPPSTPTNEKRFTVSETHAFERRTPSKLDPTYFDKTGGTESPNVENMTKISTPSSLDEYYYAVKDKILNHLHAQKISGSIQISFRLSSSGDLSSGPFVRRTSSPELVQPALDAVKASTPFLPFPAAIRQKEKEFIMDFVFE